MITSNELRIGNFIFDRYEITNVYQLDTGGTTFCQINDRRIHKESGREKESHEIIFNAIPLTEEILLKCGFEMDDSKIDPDGTPSGNFWVDYSKEGIIISMPYYEFTFSKEKTIEIKYIHQLQNLYFALTGTELEINW